MDAIGCLVSNTADDFFSSRLLKKDFNQMLNQALLMQPTQVSTDFVANLGLLRIMSDSARDSFQAFAHHHVKWLCCSIIINFNSTLSTHLFLRQVDFYLMLGTGFDLQYTDLFLCLILFQRHWHMNDQKIE